jgi:hypothetical protein
VARRGNLDDLRASDFIDASLAKSFEKPNLT